MRGLAEVLLTEHIDGDFLIGCGRSIGNEDGDVGLSEARVSEVAYWAESAALDWFAARLADPAVVEAVARELAEADPSLVTLGYDTHTNRRLATAALAAITTALTASEGQTASETSNGLAES